MARFAASSGARAPFLKLRSSGNSKMTAIQCPSCKAYISVAKATNCPRCQTALSQVSVNHSNKAPMTPARNGALTARDWLNIGLIAALLVMMAIVAVGLFLPSESKIHNQKVSTALLACQQRLSKYAKYGESETPPYVENHGGGDEFYFAWPTGSFHFKNGFGTSIPMSASCIGTLSTGEIKQVTLNGKDIE